MTSRIRFTREQIAEAVASNVSYAAAARALGYKGSTSGLMVKKYAAHYEISTSHFGGIGSHSGRSSNFVYTREELAEAVRTSRTFSDVCRKLGRTTEGGTATHIRNVVRRLGLDTSHFLKPNEYTTLRSYPRKGADAILVQLPPEANRTNADTLRRAMAEVGITHECAVCGLPPEWRGEPLTLHVDHVNGDPLDNRQENLRFLCPNCHYQQPTTKNRARRVR